MTNYIAQLVERLPEAERKAFEDALVKIPTASNALEPLEIMFAAGIAHERTCAADTIERLEAKRRRLEVVLRELVECKDLKDEELRLRQRRAVWLRGDAGMADEVNAMRDDYNRRKPLAWEAARSALNPPQQAEK